MADDQPNCARHTDSHARLLHAQMRSSSRVDQRELRSVGRAFNPPTAKGFKQMNHRLHAREDRVPSGRTAARRWIATCDCVLRARS